MIKFIAGTHPSFKEQFDKLTEAYIAGKVNPFRTCACFVGNLLNGNATWTNLKDFHLDLQIFSTCDIPKRTTDIIERSKQDLQIEGKGLYTIEDIIKLEENFMLFFMNQGMAWLGNEVDAEMEECLFQAFYSTLEALRKLHVSKGEVVDETPVFVKRQSKLQTV